jgi:hypothetical protein
MEQKNTDYIKIIELSISECFSIIYTDNEGCIRELYPYAMLVFPENATVWAVKSHLSDSQERFTLFIPNDNHNIKSTNSKFIPEKWIMNYLESSFKGKLNNEKLIGIFRIVDEKLSS